MPERTPCPDCEGGIVSYPSRSQMAPGATVYGPCPTCDGSGYMPIIADFIEAHGLGMVAEQRTSRPDMAPSEYMTRHFKCTLHAGKPTRWDGGPPSKWEREMVVWFSQGSAFTEPPTLVDVLDCLASDASGYENSRNFEDWADEYGYDPDSRTGERTYHAVAEQAKELRHFLGRDAYEQLLWKVEQL